MSLSMRLVLGAYSNACHSSAEFILFMFHSGRTPWEGLPRMGTSAYSPKGEPTILCKQFLGGKILSIVVSRNQTLDYVSTCAHPCAYEFSQ